MNELYGAYVWNYVGNEDKVEGISGNHSYIVCVENPTPNGAIWRLHMTKWFFKGDELKVMDPAGNPHYFKIDKDGFYVVNESDNRNSVRVYRIKGVRYWAEIKAPGINPDEILTIV